MNKNYIDGFVIPLPKDNVEKYRLVAEKAAAIWMDHGALSYYESVADDMISQGAVTFPQLANTLENETVVFSWIAYESREHRDAVNAKVMADPRMKEMMDVDSCPFDCKRMAYGGFQTIVKY